MSTGEMVSLLIGLSVWSVIGTIGLVANANELINIADHGKTWADFNKGFISLLIAGPFGWFYLAIGVMSYIIKKITGNNK